MEIEEIRVRLDSLKKEFDKKGGLNKIKLNSMFKNLREKYSVIKSKEKPVFNIFNILLVHDREIPHSSFLAWLLNPNENHKLGTKFLKIFMELITKNEKEKQSLKRLDLKRLELTKAEVSREVGGESSIVDIHIEIPYINTNEKFLIIIENKIFSREGTRQTLRENIDFKPNLFVFLSPFTDQSLSSSRCILVTYRDIFGLVTKLLSQNDVEKEIEFFLKQYLINLEVVIMEKDFEEFNEKTRLYIENYEMINDLKKGFEQQIKSFWDKITSLLKEQDWYARDKWVIHKATRYLQIYKKKWKKDTIFIHLEPWLNEECLADNVIELIFHIEGKDIELRKSIIAKLERLSKDLEKEGYIIERTSYREPFFKELKIDKNIFDNTIKEINNLISKVEEACDGFL